MTGDRSLDEFDADAASGDSTEGETDGGATAGRGPESDGTEGEAGTGGPTREGSGAGGAAPALGTYRWDPDGAPCAACGERAERRWRDGDAYVCADCKEW